jgi:colanic acid biosynthesis protein WcaH
MNEFIQIIEDCVQDPEKGLPDSIFYLVGRLTPFINVDLLIEHPEHGVLLTWRNDIHSGRGWHIPGGIIRFREKMTDRVKEVARLELGARIQSIVGPIDINEIIASDQKDRSHFLSLLFRCELAEEAYVMLHQKHLDDPKEIAFFKACPENILHWHKIYAKYIN